MHFLSKISLLLAAVSITFARECTTSESSPWPYTLDEYPIKDSNISLTFICNSWGSDTVHREQCLSLGRADECSGDDCSDSVADEVVVEDPSSDAEDDEVAADNGEDDQAAGTDPSGYGTRLKFTRRGEALSCVGNEKCYQWVAEYLVCYDASTGGLRSSDGYNGTFDPTTGTGTIDSVDMGKLYADGGAGGTSTGSTSSTTGPTATASAVFTGAATSTTLTWSVTAMGVNVVTFALKLLI